MEHQQWKTGTEVCLKSDPSRSGFCTGNNRQRGQIEMVRVKFSGGKQSSISSTELEILEPEDGDPYTLIDNGRFGLARDLRQSLSHILLSGHLADLIYSMGTTNTDFYAYQYKPLLALQESLANGILIADEVGLGKTIEAGLIWTELRAREDARNLVVLCPAMLREKWKLELAERFGVNADIVDSQEALKTLKQSRDNIQDGKAIICSIQGLRPTSQRGNDGDGIKKSKVSSSDKLADFLEAHKDDAPIIDLLIVDEAHYLRNPHSQNAKLGKLLRNISAKIILLSATPINLKDDDLFNLLNLIDPDSFSFKNQFPEVLEANRPLVSAQQSVLDIRDGEKQIKQHLMRAKSFPLLAKSRQLAQLINEPMSAQFLDSPANRVRVADRIDKINLLRHVISRTRRADVTEFRVIRSPKIEKVSMTREENNFYNAVTHATQEYAHKHNIHDGFLLAGPQKQVSSCMAAAAISWNEGKTDDAMAFEALGAEEELRDASPLRSWILGEVLPHIDINELRRKDSKYERLKTVLLRYLNDHPEEKVILFSYYRYTLSYLKERLEQDNVNTVRLVGGMKETKQDVIAKFRDSESDRVLLSSEVASEGVDLQFCRLLINYDLPWNPMRLEQRIGRIDRLGQQAEKIHIWNLCHKNTIDERIISRLYERLHLFERALGSMEAIVGQEVKELTTDLLSKRLNPKEEEDRIKKTALAIERISLEQEELESQASSLIAHGDFILNKVQAAHDFSRRVTDEDLVSYVQDYLARYSQGYQLQQIENKTLEFDVQLPPRTASDLSDFIKQRKLSGKTFLDSGLSF